MSPYADTRADAEAARAILSCPAEVDLAVDGVPHPLDGDARLGMQDWSGTPVLLCLPGSTLSHAGDDGRHALLTVASGLVAGDALTLAGRLRRTGSETCTCCEETRDLVVVDVSHVLLVRSGERSRVPVEEFAAPALQLNPGFLRSTADHVNRHHHDELRHAVATRLSRRVSEVLGVQLVDLTARSVELQWVTAEGAHRTVLRFPGPAADVDELGENLRHSLHPGIC